MRTVGIASALVLGVVLAVHAQPPGPPALTPAPPKADPVLDGHLLAWQKVMTGAKNFSAQFEQIKTVPPFNKQQKYTGSVLCMKPNLARMSMANVNNKQDFVAYICNGKSLFQYEWKEKLVTEYPLGPAGAGDNLMLDFLGGMTAEATEKRFHITQFNPNDKNYVMLRIKPKLAKDSQEFTQMTLALYAPSVPPPYVPYLPAQVLFQKPNDGESERWIFSHQAVNLKDIGPKVFQYEQPKGPGWQFKKEQVRPMPPGFGGTPVLPGGTGLRPGAGAVKQR